MASLIAMAVVAEGQSFFERVPKPFDHTVNPGVMGVAPAPGEPTEMNAVRPVTNIAAYAEPGHILMAGVGVSYEHLRYDTPSARWKSTWSISALTWAGAGLAPNGTEDKPSAVTYGLMAGFFNNLIMLGPAINNGKLIVAVGIGINLN